MIIVKGTKVTVRNSAGVIQKVAENRYDLLNRWTASIVDADGPGPQSPTERYFLYDGDQIVLEADGRHENHVTHRYLWGPGIDQLLASEEVDNYNDPGEITWALSDHLGTVRDLARYDTTTNATTIANHRVYDSFGNLISETNAAVDMLFGFTGRAFDEATGLQNNLHRWYDAPTGQWISEDPIFADSSNPSRYVSNAPLSKVDPSGLVEFETLEELLSELRETLARNEHRKNARKHTEQKHSTGQARKLRDGERKIIRELDDLAKQALGKEYFDKCKPLADKAIEIIDENNEFLRERLDEVNDKLRKVKKVTSPRFKQLMEESTIIREAMDKGEDMKDMVRRGKAAKALEILKAARQAGGKLDGGLPFADIVFFSIDMANNPYDENTVTMIGPKEDRAIECILSAVTWGGADIAFERAKDIVETKRGLRKKPILEVPAIMVKPSREPNSVIITD